MFRRGGAVLKFHLLLLLAVALTTIGCPPDTQAPIAQADLPVEPEAGNYLTGYWSETTSIMLADVSVTMRPCDKDYETHFMYPGVDLHDGDPCLVVAGLVENHGDKMLEIGMFARGYDENGVWAAETLDSEGVRGSITFEIEPGATHEFLLHLNPSDRVQTIRVFGGSYRDRVRAPTTPIP